MVFLLHPRLVPFPARMLAAPFLRYAGEWWAAAGTGRDPDTFSAPPLCESRRIATELCGQATSLQQIRRSPAPLAIYAARVVGWRFLSLAMLTLPTPRRELSLLQLAQPVLLRLYVDAFLAQTMEALLARRPPSRLCTRGHAVSSRLWLAPTRRLLSPGAAQLRPRAQHAQAALVAGTLHVSDTLARWGAASHCSACPMCESSPDTLEHRMWARRAEGVPFAPRLPSW